MLTRYSRYIILTLIVLCAASVFFLRYLKFDFEIEKYFPAGDEDLSYYKEFDNRFNVSKRDEYIFIAINNNNGIFQTDYLKKIEDLTNFLKEQKNILEVYSITNVSTVSIINGAIYQDSLIHVSTPHLYLPDSLNLFRSEEYRSLHLSKSGKYILVSAFTAKNLSDKEKYTLLELIQQKVETYHFDDVHYAAKILVEKTYVEEIQKNFIVYIITALLIIACTLYLIFRSIIDIIIPFLSIIISVLLTVSLIAVTGYTLDSVTSLLPSILAIICMSNVIHISIKYKEELALGFHKQEALSRTFREIFLASFFTSLTTAIGFFTLCITTVKPILLFGLFTGLGIMIAWIVSLAFIFSFYSITPVPVRTYAKQTNQKWEKLLSWIFRKNIRNWKSVMISALILLIISTYFIFKVEINSSLLINIPKNNPILENYEFFEREFGGTRIFECGLEMRDSSSSFLDIAQMNQVLDVENFLKDSCGLGLVISPIMFFKTANKVLSQGYISQYKLPANQDNLNICLNYIRQSDWGPEILSYISPDGQFARITGKVPDLTIKEFDALRQKIINYFRTHDPPFAFDFRLTGSGVLLDKVTYLLFYNLLYGLLIGIVLMSLISGLMMRSFKMSFLMLFPNILPIIIMAAVMGIFGIYLKSDTSIIFTIALGIAVDNTIHLMSKFMIEKRKGLSTLYAMKRSFLSRGKAMIISTLVLAAGFLTLLFSSFQGTFNVGLLITVSMVFALLFDLTLTPLLIMFFFSKKTQAD